MVRFSRTPFGETDDANLPPGQPNQILYTYL